MLKIERFFNTFREHVAGFNMSILTDPPEVRVQDALLEDYVSSEIDDTPVFASVAPWNPMHDILVDRETQTLVGIVYPVAARERAAIAAICQSLPKQVIRYCISPVSAAAVLSNSQTQLLNSLSEMGDPNVSVKQFPESLRPPPSSSGLFDG